MSEYDLNKKPIRVVLSRDVVEKVHAFADAVASNKEVHGTGWERNYRLLTSEMPIRETSIFGFLGEAALCQVLGVPFAFDLYENGDEGWDLEIAGFRAQVKTGCGRNLILHSLNRFHHEADVLVFVEFLGRRTILTGEQAFDVWGWCSRKDFMEHHQTKVFKEAVANPYVPAKNLRPLGTLFDYSSSSIKPISNQG